MFTILMPRLDPGGRHLFHHVGGSFDGYTAMFTAKLSQQTSS